jgi:dTDP-4-amino-4,6-dideoxygalactose transaminase
MTTSRIAHFGLARQYRNLKDELLDATDKVLRSGQLMDGATTAAFETWLAMRTGTTFAITVHSGTQALEIMALWAKEPFKTVFQINPTVVLPNITYVATLNAFMRSGYDVEIADTDKNGLMVYGGNVLHDASKIVCTVGLYGANPNTNIGYFTSRIVDGAQHWLVADSIGDGMAISFDPTKNLNASGNGGAIVTNDRDLYDFAYSFRSNGKPNHEDIGTNSRMSELDCAHLLVRTKYIDKWQWRRKEIRHHYLDEFKNLDLHCLSRDFLKHADQKFVIYTSERDRLYQHLLDKNIDVKIHYPHTLSEYMVTAGVEVKPDMLSKSVMLSRGVLSLPIYPELSDSEVEYIADSVKEFFTASYQ